MPSPSVRWLGNDWTVIPLPPSAAAAPAARRRGATPAVTAEPDILQAALQDSRFKVVEDALAMPAAGGARRGTAPDLALDVTVGPTEGAVMAVRHPSGAVTFHPPSAPVARRRSTGQPAGARTVTFRVPVRGTAPAADGRRSVLTKALRVVVLKVAGAVADLVLPKLVRAWETRTWKKNGRAEGWLKVTPEALRSGKLAAATPPAGRRSLALIHGTFSHAAAAFGPLAKSDFFDRVASRYDGGVYAFNHFSLSRTPAENAKMLAEGLDGGGCDLDVVTHSRGGLVLRTLVERPD